MEENDYGQVDHGQGEIIVLIGDICKERGITPSRLAKMTGLSRPTCYKLIDGDIKRIEFLTLALICHVLGVPVNRLLYYKPRGESSSLNQIG